jgi:hypothetical protein
MAAAATSASEMAAFPPDPFFFTGSTTGTAGTTRAGVRGRMGPASLTGGADAVRTGGTEAARRSSGMGATSPRREDGGADSAAFILAEPERS